MVTNRALKFSVIIPTFNSGHYISACLDSVLGQSYGNWECIVVDDASEDSTDSVVKSYCDKDSRIKYYRLPVNCGPSIARNDALTRITGEYVLFLDSDDLIAPQKLHQAANIVADRAVDFVFTDYAFFKEDKDVLSDARCFLDEFSPGLISAAEIRNKLLYENIFTISCVISKAGYLKDIGFFDNLIRYNEDWDLWLRASFKNPVYYYDPCQDGVTYIRNHNSSHSKDMIGMYINGLYVCKKNYDSLDLIQKKVMYKKICYHRYILKTILVSQYSNNREMFLSTLQRLDGMPCLENELRSFRTARLWFPKAFCGFYLKYLNLTHMVADKCL